MPFTLVLCVARPENTKWEPFVLVVEDVPILPNPGSEFSASGDVLGDIITVTLNEDEQPIIHHRTDGIRPRTTVFFNADVHDVLVSWTRESVLRAFTDIGWKAYTIQEAEAKFTFFGFT